jgi:fumarylacetoacetate (FAA) hydrolase family protein
MTDVTSGWFALGGALIGATATQVTTIINTVSKGKARKQKVILAAAAAKAAKRRPRYEQLIHDLDGAAEYVAWVGRTLNEPGRAPANRVGGLRSKLAAVRTTSVSVQIDGSDGAKSIATSVLERTTDLWQQVTEKTELTKDALTKAHDALVLGHTEMIDASREDFGG